jgi:selenocysteine-specific elongation factor
MSGANLVIGTAGHIDHGKTSLVRMLTGVDLDTHPEERERGITIALGFTALELSDGRRAAFVDVPGHERLVRTMISGATGIDAVILCISAVDGVMPQTREHFAILELLGVREGFVALTMIDLVDEELAELAAEDAAELVQGSFLEGKPILGVSSVTGEGRDAMIAAIGDLDATGRRADGPFRLPVDRAFVRPGFGTVVTGTVASGRLEDGENAVLLPGGTEVRVRGMQAHGEKSSEVAAGWRAALNLAGIDKSAVPRGTVVARGEVPCPLMIDVRYTHLPSAAALEDGAPVRVLLGTAERLGRIHLAENRDELRPGAVAFAQLRLDGPMPCRPGDRYVIRRTSPVETLGGGEVVDPWTRRMRRKDRVEWGKQLAQLHGGNTEVWLVRAGEEGLAVRDFADRDPAGTDIGVLLGGRLFARRIVARLEGALLEAVQTFHDDNPLSLGANRRELRRGRLGHLADRVFDALVVRLAESGTVIVKGPLLRVTGFDVTLDADQAALQQKILATITAGSFAGVGLKALHERHKQPEVTALVYLLEAAGSVTQVSGLGVVATSVLDDLTRTLQQWFAENQQLTPGDFKDLTGLSRKGAIPLLEWLDQAKLTQRTPGARVRGKLLPT